MKLRINYGEVVIEVESENTNRLVDVTVAIARALAICGTLDLPEGISNAR